MCGEDLPDILAAPNKTLYDTDDPAKYRGAGGLDIRTNRQRLVANSVRTGGIIRPENIRGARYDEV